MDLFGIGPAGAARILADVVDISRFPNRNHFASWTGTAPLDACSGAQIRHRLSRAGNRRLNHVLSIAAIVQIRHNTPGRAYYQRKLGEGKTPLEALRCLKRRISDAVYRQLLTDATIPTADGASPGGHSGATTASSAAGPTPTADSSDQPQPEPAATTLPRTRPAPTPHPASAPATPRRRDRGVKVQRPQRSEDERP